MVSSANESCQRKWCGAVICINWYWTSCSIHDISKTILYFLLRFYYHFKGFSQISLSGYSKLCAILKYFNKIQKSTWKIYLDKAAVCCIVLPQMLPMSTNGDATGIKIVSRTLQNKMKMIKLRLVQRKVLRYENVIVNK